MHIDIKICRRVAAAAVVSVSLSAQATPVINQASGLSAPDTLIDFGIGLFPTGADITNQFAGDGVTFGPTYEYLDVGDFGPSDAFGSLMNDNSNTTPNQPGAILFASDVSAAVFSWRTTADMTTFSAFLDGSLVESFSAASNDDTPPDSGKFYGFADIVFDEIRLSITGADTGFTLDNLQYTVADVVTYKEGSPDPFLGGTYSGAEDTMILTNSGGQQDQNFGGRDQVAVGEDALVQSDGRRHVLFRFDLSSLAGQFSAINSVTLRLFVRVVGDPAGTGDTVQVFRLSDANAGWVEGTGVTAVGGDPPDIGESTWNQRVQGSQNWAGSAGANTTGTDYTDLLATASFDSSTAAGAAIDLKFEPSLVQGLIEDWTTGINAGLFLRTATESNKSITFHSSEASDAALRPQLIIDFTPTPNQPPSGTCVQPPAGLISWWDGDGDSSDIQDGNNGTPLNGVAFAPGFVTSGNGQAFSFDGVNDFVSIAHNDNLNVTSHTIEAWIRPPSFVPSGFLTILAKTTPAPVERTFGLFIERAGVSAPRTPGALVGSFTNGPNNFMVLSGNTVVTDGNFHHVAMTYDAPSGTMRLYVDGNLDAETMFAPGTLPDVHMLPASIGADLSLPAGNAQLFFNGLIDELELYNRALSAAEIRALFLAGSAGKCKGQAPPTAPTVDLVAASDTGTSNTDNITNNTAPTFEGTAQPQSTVELFADGGSLGTTVADAAGAWSLTTALTEGVHTMMATATDALGQVSAPSAALIVTVDTTEPSLTASLSPAPNANGWNNTNVTVSFNCTDALSGVAGGPPTPVTVSTEGSHTVTGTCEDVAGNTAEVTIAVNLDKTPPLIVGLPMLGCTLWPPNHRLIPVAMVIPSDGLSGIATEALTAVSNEPEDGKGDGHTYSDIVIKDGRVKVRAERSGQGNGRVYTITASATDLAGNTTKTTATCEVPHDRGKGKEEKKKKQQKKQHKKNHKRK